jgi:chemotaxis protein CheD
LSFTKQAQTNNIIEIAMGGLGFTTPEKNILQTFVGSCVAICIFDPETKIAGMAHVMLPKNNTSEPNPKPEGKFADIALKTLIERLVTNGAKLSRLKAKMAGGANIFQNENKKTVFNIGMRNAETIRTTLAEKKISLVSEDIGSTGGRWVIYDANSSEMKVKERTKGVKII